MKVGIFYFTTGGNTEAMAEALQEGFVEVGAELLLRQVSEAETGDFADLDLVCLGSPAQGAEAMDETEFLPFYAEHKDKMAGKNVFLFGSFGWGDGQYMEDFSAEAEEDGLKVVGILTCLEAPSDDVIADLKAKAQELAS